MDMKDKLQLHFTLECRDRNGKLLWKIRRRSKSFVIAFFRNLEALFIYGDASGTCLDIVNVARTIRATQAQRHGAINAPAANQLWGIVVGTGIGAVAPTDFRLGTQIAHGVAPGNLQYGGTAIGGALTTATDCLITVSRAFTNASGGAITVNEIGIYAMSYATTAAEQYFCFIRDLVVPGRVINNGATATATYTLSATA